jgi:rubredoxin
MVAETQRDDMTWYECEACGLLFDDREDCQAHEANCDAEEPAYIQ